MAMGGGVYSEYGRRSIFSTLVLLLKVSGIPDFTFTVCLYQEPPVVPTAKGSTQVQRLSWN